MDVNISQEQGSGKDTPETLGQRITFLRRRQGLTQGQLAVQLGISPQAVSKWESDQSCPDILTLVPLSKIFGVSTDQLLGEEELDETFGVLLPAEEPQMEAENEEAGDSQYNENGRQVLIPSGEITGIRVDLGAVEAEIREGEQFRLELYGYEEGRCQSRVVNGIWRIQERTVHFGIFYGFHRVFRGRKAIITVPKGYIFQSAALEIGAGTMLVDGFQTKTCRLETGAGELILKRFYSGDAHMECGMGKIKLEGGLSGKCKLSCGMGSIEMRLKQLERYGYRLDVGMGEVKIGDSSFGGIGGHQYVGKDAENFFDVDCGMGSISLQFEEV